MKEKFILLTTIFTMTLLSCNTDKKPTVSGINPENLDTTAIAGDDFYQYANGGWMASHPLKPEYSRFGTFDELGEQSVEQVKNLITDLSPSQNKQGSVAQKIGDLYALAMDSDRLNSDGIAPLLPFLQQIATINSKEEITETLAEMFRNGASPFFVYYIYADDMNSSINILHVNQGGYKMGDRDYYLLEDEHSKMLRTKYVEMLEKLFSLSGFTETETKAASEAVMTIETRLAKVASSREALRDPIANYHKISLEELEKLSPEISWKKLFKALNGLQNLNVGQLAPIAEVSKIITETSLNDLKYYLSWNVISSAVSFLSDEFSAASFEYYGKALSGKEVQRERWKRAVATIDGSLGEAVGQIYVEKYFPPSSKEKMLTLVKNLQTALAERIKNLEWMGDSTKTKALEKLAAFHIKIGYPDKWRDYGNLSINKEYSYLENIVASIQFDYDYMVSKFDKPVDKDEWLMNPQTVNAYYNPATNEICFPAAILQPPFFNPEADDASNYGAIGVVIGHEMTHGFDDQGRKFDKDGNLNEWWTEEDAKRFNERAQVLVDFFNNIIVIDSVHANGQFTLGENIADQSGLQVSWQAYQNTLKGKEIPKKNDGFTDAQHFFLAYATVWAGNIRDAEILHRTKMDPHSLGRWRVNGALPQIDAWYDAFGITEENKMYIPKEKRVAIW
ncbi:MAG: M13 family metallopeptidase [Dysgonamonadaceae bacterium]|jgi:putative endopeptidase|nr:M13 family metallopeptidase [Dysgonamonadaceae bacterium]